MAKKDIFVAKSADIVDRVKIGDGSSVWYQAVLRGDDSPIVVGQDSNIQDGTVVHGSVGYPVTVGNNVTVGHNCIIHGCTIGDNNIIGMGSTILNGAVIGKNSIVGAGSLVTQHKVFPDGKLIIGSPAKAVRDLTKEEIQSIQDNADEYTELMHRNPGRAVYEDEEGYLRTR